MTKQRVFITGGAAGLGRALAQAFVARGAQVCIGDKDTIAGQASADTLEVKFLPCDVTDAATLVAAAKTLTAEWGGVDLVINNAGVAQMGQMTETPIEDWQWIIDINVLGIVRSVAAFTPVFRAQGHGTFLNIASMAGFLYLPGSAAYNATKAAVVALSETMMLELEEDGITTQVACPSFFRTDLARNMRAADDASARMTTRLVERARMTADDVAEAILDGLAAGTPHILTHPGTRKAWLIKRLMPFGRYLNGMRNEVAKLNARMARAPKR